MFYEFRAKLGKKGKYHILLNSSLYSICGISGKWEYDNGLDASAYDEADVCKSCLVAKRKHGETLRPTVDNLWIDCG